MNSKFQEHFVVEKAEIVEKMRETNDTVIFLDYSYSIFDIIPNIGTLANCLVFALPFHVYQIYSRLDIKPLTFLGYPLPPSYISTLMITVVPAQVSKNARWISWSKLLRGTHLKPRRHQLVLVLLYLYRLGCSSNNSGMKLENTCQNTWSGEVHDEHIV